MREALKRGAEAYVRGDHAVAVRAFAAVVEEHPASPLARYDLGVAMLTMGDRRGLAELDRAQALACNVFLQYQVALWKVGVDLDVPLVDVTLFFQAHDQEPLFIDAAHPSREGHRIVADALWPALAGLDRQRASAGRSMP